MHETMPYRDLCATCRHLAYCKYPKEKGHPIHYCSEHEAWEDYNVHVSLALLKTKDADPNPNPETPVEEIEDNRPKGLCVNCENRETCNFPKPEGGVWHCEEYK